MKPWEQYQRQEQGPWTKYAAPVVETPASPADVPFTKNLAAGMGATLNQAHLGLRKLGSKVGIGDEGAIQAEMDETMKRDRPLMDSGGGMMGSFLTNTALLAVPGANSAKGMAMLGGALGAVQPTTKDESIVGNAAIGAGLGVAGKVAGDKIAGALTSKLTGSTTKAATAEAQNAVRDAALKAGQEVGYVVPPASVKGSATNKVVESFAGKIGTEQAASIQNQTVTDTLARKALGLGGDAPLTESALKAMRETEGKAYEMVKRFGEQVNLKLKADQAFRKEVDAIGGDFSKAAKEFPETSKNAAIESLKMDLARGAWTPGAIVEKVKQLRFEAKSNFKAFDNPERVALAHAQRDTAAALDGLLERQLSASGAGNLATEYRAARVAIAKVHDVEAALTGGGHVDARVLVKMADRKPLSGELAQIVDFAKNFPKAVNTPERIGSEGVHVARAGVGGALGYALDGIGGAGLGTVAAVMGPSLARNAMLSGAGQRFMAQPNYGVNPLLKYGTAPANALSKYSNPALAGALSYRGIPAYVGEE